MTAAPKPAPAEQPGRVPLARAPVHVARRRRTCSTYSDWLIRAPASTVNAAYDLPNASGLAWLPLADGSKPFGVIENSS